MRREILNYCWRDIAEWTIVTFVNAMHDVPDEVRAHKGSARDCRKPEAEQESLAQHQKQVV